MKRSVSQDDPNTLHYFWPNYDGKRVAPHSDLTLSGWPNSGQVAQGGVGQTHHIAFRATNSEDQLAWREHLLGMGLNVSEVMERTYFQSIYFRAPDGLLLEIATDGPGFAVAEEPERLGQTLKLPAWLEVDRERIAATLIPLE